MKASVTHSTTTAPSTSLLSRVAHEMVVYLRRNGFPDVHIDGERSTDFDNALRSCVLDRVCGRGITRHI